MHMNIPDQFARYSVKDDDRVSKEPSDPLRSEREMLRSSLMNGGSIVDASLILSNSVEMNLLNAHLKTDEADYLRALFCVINDPNIPEAYYRRFRENREFNLVAKIHHGDAFHSYIERYNGMQMHELEAELTALRSSLVDLCYWASKRSFDPLIQSFLVSGKDTACTLIGEFGGDFYNADFFKFDSWKNAIQKRFDALDTKACLYSNPELGGSFPERVMNAVLIQKGVEYVREMTFPWSYRPDLGMKKARRYDFYIRSTNTIIEVQGAQHYYGWGSSEGRTLEEERYNDDLKRRLARENGVSDYIEVDARSSDFDYLRQSIMNNSQLNQLFNTASIDWNVVWEMANGCVKNEYNLPLTIFVKKYLSAWIRFLNDRTSSMAPIPDFYKQSAVVLGDCVAMHCPLLPEEYRSDWKEYYGIKDPYSNLEFLLHSGYLFVTNKPNRASLMTKSCPDSKIFDEESLQFLDSNSDIEYVTNGVVNDSYYEISSVGCKFFYSFADWKPFAEKGSTLYRPHFDKPIDKIAEDQIKAKMSSPALSDSMAKVRKTSLQIISAILGIVFCLGVSRVLVSGIQGAETLPLILGMFIVFYIWSLTEHGKEHFKIGNREISRYSVWIACIALMILYVFILLLSL